MGRTDATPDIRSSTQAQPSELMYEAKPYPYISNICTPTYISLWSHDTSEHSMHHVSYIPERCTSTYISVWIHDTSETHAPCILHIRNMLHPHAHLCGFTRLADNRCTMYPTYQKYVHPHTYLCGFKTLAKNMMPNACPKKNKKQKTKKSTTRELPQGWQLPKTPPQGGSHLRSPGSPGPCTILGLREANRIAELGTSRPKTCLGPWPS
jgi:hypothetical protein